jgi:lysyl-tRNA synthetase, class II
MNQPDYHQHEEFQNRMRKLKEVKDLGINPYPYSFKRSHLNQELHKKYQDQDVATFDEAMEKKSPKVSISGRIVLSRPMGKNIFTHIQDSTDRIQVLINRDFCTVSGYEVDTENPMAPKPQKVFEKKLDLGDIVGCEGYLFRTQKGELTVMVEEATLLCKTLLPLPDKHSGLEDKETRYRKRWLDLISNKDVFHTFQVRSAILKQIREHLSSSNFMEVETPVLQTIYGGAAASPFITTLNAFDQEMFMRISLEISLKKLMVGGFDRVFEIGKVFRNEGMDRTHNPEFTMLEAYVAYWDYNQMMEFVENLFELIAKTLNNGSTIVKFPKGVDEEVEIDFKAPWKRISMIDSIKEYAKIDVIALSDEEMKEKLKQTGNYSDDDLKKFNKRGLLIQALFEEFVEEHLIQPQHIIDHPIETTPLCKPHRDPKLKEMGLVERFECFVVGKEICNAYTELNDPIIQRELLEQQSQKRDQGDEEACPLDEDFIEAICQGMPPCSGVGIGIDRLVMLFSQSSSIRDVLFFPWMKPVNQSSATD